jgi:spermidine synthase
MRKPSRAELLAPATLSEFDGVRYLHLGTPWVQGAMRIRKPQAIELEYVQRMMAWTLLRPQGEAARGHAVQLGLGAGSITRFTYKAMRMKTTAVEINPTVIGVCRAYFHLPEDGARLKVVCEDAAQWVADPARAGCADAVCVDLYDHEAAAPVLDDEAFYRACHRVLADGGVMSVNLFGRDASFARSAGRIAAAFGHDAATPCVWALKPTREGNTIVLAGKALEMPDRETLAARAESLERRFALPATKWLRMMRPLRTEDARARRKEQPE